MKRHRVHELGGAPCSMEGREGELVHDGGGAEAGTACSWCWSGRRRWGQKEMNR